MRARLREALAAATVLAAMTACTGDGDRSASESGAPGPGVLGSEPAEAPSPPSDLRPFEALESDEPGGPVHEEALSARPVAAEVVAVAGVEDRLHAERFAVLVVNAVTDQSGEGLGVEELEAFLSADLHPEARSTVDQQRVFEGQRTVAGAREEPWIRSREVAAGAGASSAFEVQFVELTEWPMSDEEPPYRAWSMYQATVQFEGDAWRLVDFKAGVASESGQFSDVMWENKMDAGRDWRRFPLQ